jgi:hypothetical protein
VRPVAAALALLIVTCACSASEAPTRETVTPPDGQLDCAQDITWLEQGDVGPDAHGDPNPQRELDRYLAPWVDTYGGVIAHVGDATASLVIASREVVIARASRAPAGGWIVLSSEGCAAFSLQGGTGTG